MQLNIETFTFDGVFTCSLLLCERNACIVFPMVLLGFPMVLLMFPMVLLMFPMVLLVCQLLRKCILNMSKPSVEGPLGNPPFEKPSIAKVCNIYNISSQATTDRLVCKFHNLL